MTIEIPGDGDRWLSSNDLRLWALVQDILLRWHTLVIFRHRGINVAEGQRELIEFFVPKQSPHWALIHEYLEQELETFAHEDTRSEHGVFPGTEVNVSIKLFSGLSPYIDAPTMKGLITNALATFKDKLA